MTRPIKTGKMQVVNMDTGEVIEEKRNAFAMLPPAGDVCQECATQHDLFAPHNQQSLYYQMQFNAKHGRFPTWTDAMAHCGPDTRAFWREELVRTMTEAGMEIPPDLLGDEPPERPR